MKVNPTDIFRLPFKLAERVSKPVMDCVEGLIGKDVDTFVEALPGGKMLQDATRSFNNWMLEAPEKKKLADAEEVAPETDEEEDA